MWGRGLPPPAPGRPPRVLLNSHRKKAGTLRVLILISCVLEKPGLFCSERRHVHPQCPQKLAQRGERLAMGVSEHRPQKHPRVKIPPVVEFPCDTVGSGPSLGHSLAQTQELPHAMGIANKREKSSLKIIERPR